MNGRLLGSLSSSEQNTIASAPGEAAEKVDGVLGFGWRSASALR
jgi:hypothetical protein